MALPGDRPGGERGPHPGAGSTWTFRCRDGGRRLLRGERAPLLRLPFLRVLSVSQKNVLLCCFAIGAWLTGREVPFLDLSTAGLEQAVHVRSPIHGRTTPTPS